MECKNYLKYKQQLQKIERYRLQEGRGDGMRLMRVQNGLGLDFIISEDRCMDISELYLDGIKLNYTSPVGYVSPQYYKERVDGFGFLESFTGGLFTTCGLQNIGNPNIDNGVFRGLHGTISNIPAEQIYYTKDEQFINIHSCIHDEILFGTRLVIERTIKCSLTENLLVINDVVRNHGEKEEPMMLLYHINIGYPMLDETTKLHIDSTNISSRNEHAKKDEKSWDQMLPPIKGFEEQCYYHTSNKEKMKVVVQNPNIKKKIEISFKTSDFPILGEWKMMGIQDYVLGLEPSTNKLEGRAEARQKDKLLLLKSGEKKEFEVTMRFSRL